MEIIVSDESEWDVPNNYPCGIVFAEDISSDASWLTKQEAAQTRTKVCITCGWIITDGDDDYIRVASDMSLNEEGDLEDVGGVTTIPECNVITIKRKEYV